MKNNLNNEMIFEATDIAPHVQTMLAEQSFCHIKHKEGTKKGIIKSDESLEINIRGLYVIYKNEIPVYAGLAKGKAMTISNRVGRFVSRLQGTNRADEDHSGAKRYLKFFGNDFMGLSIKVIDLARIEAVLVGSNITLPELEKSLISSLNTICNKVGRSNVMLQPEQFNALYKNNFYQSNFY